LLHKKSQSLDKFKIYKDEVENQLNRKIKAFKSDYGGERYSRYNRSGRCPGPFANFWKSDIIVVYHARDTSSEWYC